jgi:hypothetical protein
VNHRIRAGWDTFLPGADSSIICMAILVVARAHLLTRHAGDAIIVLVPLLIERIGEGKVRHFRRYLFGIGDVPASPGDPSFVRMTMEPVGAGVSSLTNPRIAPTDEYRVVSWFYL